jgi:hypothetical protein
VIDCIRDDSTECDCPRCVGDEDRFWAEQDGSDDDDRDRCVLGAECCCPHPFHGADECYSAEMAEAFMRAESVRPQLTGRRRTRALWRKRGRR